MTKEFQFLMHLVTAGGRGERLEKPEYEVDWLQIEKLAKEQMVTALVGYALKLSPDIGCPGEIRKRMLLSMRQTAIVNTTKKTAILELLGRMEAAGIHTVLLKGFEAAACYAAPECRGAGDTDILVDPGEEKRACAFLRQEGFHVMTRWEHGHHAVATHPTLGIVELHILLYDEIIEKMWFGGKDGAEYVREPHRLIHTGDGDYYALGYTDNLIFLALHTIKHFIESGMGIRMMLDVVLWIVGRRSELDMPRFWNVMTELKYDQLMNCILHALIRYGGFTEMDFPGIGAAEEQQIHLILNDLEEGGWLGMHEKTDRKDGWHAYNRQKMLQSMKPWQYKLYMFKWQKGLLKEKIFPSKAAMIRRYPCLAKNPWLMPFAWLHRLIFRGSRAVQEGVLTEYIVDDESALTEDGKARIRMFKELGMM